MRTVQVNEQAGACGRFRLRVLRRHNEGSGLNTPIDNTVVAYPLTSMSAHTSGSDSMVSIYNRRASELVGGRWCSDVQGFVYC